MDKKSWTEKLAVYDSIIERIPEITRKGKTMPYTSANGYMFSQLNKDGQLGIRLPKEAAEEFKKTHNTTDFKSYGAVMKDYVLVPESIVKNKQLIATYLEVSYNYVMSLKPKK